MRVTLLVADISFKGDEIFEGACLSREQRGTNVVTFENWQKIMAVYLFIPRARLKMMILKYL